MTSSKYHYVISSYLVVALLATDLHGQSPPAFPHAYHLQDEGLACIDCHDSVSEAPPATGAEACQDCHENGAPGFDVANPARPLRVPFPHAVHVGLAACLDCHAATADDAQTTDTPLVLQPACASCHLENGVGDEGSCAPCHDEGAGIAERQPDWHDDAWRTEHAARMGTVDPDIDTVSDVDPRFDRHGYDCASCHGANACMDCHQLRKPMSHRIHLGPRGAGCDNCHALPAAGLPQVDTQRCSDCHEGSVQTHLLRGALGRSLALPDFPHRTHSDAVPCTDCHESTAQDTHLAGAPFVIQTRCVQCHEARDVPVAERSCARCHARDELREAPKTHTRGWRPRHGLAEALATGAPHGADDCTLCHEANACTVCHSTTRPTDHNGLWRVRLHGESAEWDRDRCAVCHETGSCIGCHKSTAPLSHVGAWNAVHGVAAEVKDNDRCGVCHSNGWCASCHQGLRP